MNQELPTIGQLERDLSQNIQKLYKELLQHSPKKVVSKFFDNQLAIVVEDALTAVEKTLVNEHNDNRIVENLNLAINDVLKSKFQTVIETTLKVEVEDILFDSTIETKRTGAIVILDRIPEVRSSKSLYKIPKIQLKNEPDRSKADNEFLPLTMKLSEQEVSNGYIEKANS